MITEKEIAPILLMVFNRPDETKLVFNAIKKVQPKKLYIASDGPRKHVEGEIERCNQVKDIIKCIDWNCEVKTLFREENLGCKYAVSSAINWFFENETKGIILEDDTLPSNSFFHFCTELLNKFENDTRVMRISGFNPLSDQYSYNYDYFFSYYSFMWGWATWKRVWLYNDVEMLNWENAKKNNIINSYPFDKDRNACFQDAINGLDTWDYQFDFAILCQNGLQIVPTKSLVQNIGFNERATHTFSDNGSGRSKIISHDLVFPLRAPEFMLPNYEFEKILIKSSKDKFSLKRRVYKLYKLVISIFKR
jgi:hypothetical protein